MKLDQFNTDVLNTATDSSEYSMEMNGTAFAIMSDNLYQHKIPAVIRELISNAADSHLEAEKQSTPIRVTLPNRFNQNLVIEDFGLGLSDEETRRTFAGYFKSTKRDSDIPTGAFGVGSKSPFSITSNFTVQSRKDGEENLYSCYVGSDWIPQISKIHSKRTECPNGVKVTIPIQQKDFQSVVKESSIIFSFVRVPVEVTGTDSFSIFVDDVDEQIQTNGFVRLPNEGNFSSIYKGNPFYALMGGVIYPIPESIYSTLKGSDIAFDGSRYSSTFHPNYNSVVIPFENGTLKPAASREYLSLDRNTERVIKETIQSLIDSILKETQEKIDKCDNIFDAVSCIKNPTASHQRYFTYKGIPLKKYIDKSHTDAIIIPYDEEMKSYIIRRNSNGRYCDNIPGNISHSQIGSLPDLYGRYYRDHKNYAFYREGDVKSNFTTLTRRYARMVFNDSDKVIQFDKKLSKHKRDRIDKFLGVRLNWISLEEVKEFFKSDPKARDFRNLRQRTDTTVYAGFYDSNGRYHVADNNDLSDDVVYYRCVKENEEYINISRKLFWIMGICKLLKEHHQKDIRILVQNSNNIKKLERNNVKELNKETLDNIVEKNKDLVEYNVVFHYDVKYERSDGSIRFNSRYLNAVVHTNDELMKSVKKRCYSLREKVESKKSSAIGRSFKYHIKSDLRDDIRKLEKRYDVVDSCLMTSAVGRVEGGIDARVVVAKMVDFCHRNGYSIDDMVKEMNQ